LPQIKNRDKKREHSLLEEIRRGGEPDGLSAVKYASRAKLKTIALDKSPDPLYFVILLEFT
jgi:hypothetical protein